MANEGTTRREFIKKAAYLTPAILTLQAMPEYAKAGSKNHEKKEKKEKKVGD